VEDREGGGGKRDRPRPFKKNISQNASREKGSRSNNFGGGGKRKDTMAFSEAGGKGKGEKTHQPVVSGKGVVRRSDGEGLRAEKPERKPCP